MIVSDLQDLKLYPVHDRGIPNRERIPIQVVTPTNMGQFGLMVGVSNYPSVALPLLDNLFWFGDAIVKPGDWILVYTGAGEPRTDDWTNPPGAKVYSLHWGRSSTVFANSSIVPILFSVKGVDVGISPADLPQYAALPSS